MTRQNLFVIHRIFKTLMVISLVMGLGFFVTNNLDFLINAITYQKAALPNIAYWLSKLVGTIFIPLVFLLPSFERFERIRMIKYTFVTYGILQILTLSWVFWYIGANGFDGLFSNDAVMAFQSAKENSFVASYVYWDTYSWFGNLVTLIFSALCIYTGLEFYNHKNKVCTLAVLLAAFRILVPAIFNIVTQNGFLSSFWVTNNYADAITIVLFAAAMIVARADDEAWIYHIWDQEIERPGEDEFGYGLDNADEDF